MVEFITSHFNSLVCQEDEYETLYRAEVELSPDWLRGLLEEMEHRPPPSDPHSRRLIETFREGARRVISHLEEAMDEAAAASKSAEARGSGERDPGVALAAQGGRRGAQAAGARGPEPRRPWVQRRRGKQARTLVHSVRTAVGVASVRMNCAAYEQPPGRLAQLLAFTSTHHEKRALLLQCHSGLLRFSELPADHSFCCLSQKPAQRNPRGYLLTRLVSVGCAAVGGGGGGGDGSLRSAGSVGSEACVPWGAGLRAAGAALH